LVGDATGKTTVHLGNPQGFVAAGGTVNLKTTTMTPANLLQSLQAWPNFNDLNAIFSYGGSPVVFNTGGNLSGLLLMEAELASIRDIGGMLNATIP